MAYKEGTRKLVTLWLKTHIWEHHEVKRGKVSMNEYMNDVLEEHVPKSKRPKKK